MVCATSKASDQSAHMRSLIRAFASRLLHRPVCTGPSESIHVKIPHCWKSRVTAHIYMTSHAESHVNYLAKFNIPIDCEYLNTCSCINKTLYTCIITIGSFLSHKNLPCQGEGHTHHVFIWRHSAYKSQC